MYMKIRIIALNMASIKLNGYVIVLNSDIFLRGDIHLQLPDL